MSFPLFRHDKLLFCKGHLATECCAHYQPDHQLVVEITGYYAKSCWVDSSLFDATTQNHVQIGPCYGGSETNPEGISRQSWTYGFDGDADFIVYFDLAAWTGNEPDPKTSQFISFKATLDGGTPVTFSMNGGQVESPSSSLTITCPRTANAAFKVLKARNGVLS